MPAEHVFAAEEEEEGAIAAFNPLRRRAAAPFEEIIYFWLNNQNVAINSGEEKEEEEILNDTALLKAKARAASSYARGEAAICCPRERSGSLVLARACASFGHKESYFIANSSNAYTCTSELLPC